MPYPKDSVQRFIFEDYPIRGEITRLDESFREIMQQHDYPPIIRNLLGEALIAAVLLNETIKFKGQLTIQFQSSGAVKLLVAKCNHLRHIRGLVQWEASALESEVISTLDKGQLVVTIERDDLVQPYQSIVSLEKKTITEALEYYFTQSEQVPTKLIIEITDEKAGGVLLQMLPSDKVQDRENFWKYASFLQEDLADARFLEQDNAEVLQRTFDQEDLQLYEVQHVGFRCTCSYLKMQEAIRITGREEALNILKEKPSIVVTCQYCNREYMYNRAEVDEIFGDREG